MCVCLYTSVAYAKKTVGHAIFIKSYLSYLRKKCEKHWFRPKQPYLITKIWYAAGYNRQNKRQEVIMS